MPNTPLNEDISRTGVVFRSKLQSPREKVKSQRTRSFLDNLKPCSLHVSAPPVRSASTAMRHQWSEGEFCPWLVGDYHQWKISARNDSKSAGGRGAVGYDAASQQLQIVVTPGPTASVDSDSLRQSSRARGACQAPSGETRIRGRASYFPSKENARSALPGAPPNIPYPELK